MKKAGALFSVARMPEKIDMDQFVHFPANTLRSLRIQVFLKNFWPLD
jgi:hypothetical protein